MTHVASGSGKKTPNRFDKRLARRARRRVRVHAMHHGTKNSFATMPTATNHAISSIATNASSRMMVTDTSAVVVAIGVSCSGAKLALTALCTTI